MPCLRPARALGLAAALLLLLAWGLGPAEAKRKPKLPRITSAACDALNRALLEAYFRPDLGNGYAFTRPGPVARCSRSLARLNESSLGDALYDLENARRYFKVRLRATAAPPRHTPWVPRRKAYGRRWGKNYEGALSLQMLQKGGEGPK